MPRYLAFLRAINVGGHTVKMERLRQLFAALGFTEVETFIASGNVLFSSPDRKAAALEAQIAQELHSALGYEVATFLRTEAELRQIVAHPAFAPAEVAAATAYNVAFLASALNSSAVQKLMALTTDIDRFAIHGREIYWLCQKKQSESTFSNAMLEKTLKVKSTLRGMKTLAQMAAKFAP